jgi:hypothetical protein
VVELVRHWYGGRFGAQLLNFGNAATVHLQKFSRLATSVPVRRLTRAGRPSSMLDQIALVEADLAS